MCNLGYPARYKFRNLHDKLLDKISSRIRQISYLCTGRCRVLLARYRSCILGYLVRYKFRNPYGKLLDKIRSDFPQISYLCIGRCIVLLEEYNLCMRKHRYCYILHSQYGMLEKTQDNSNVRILNTLAGGA